MTENEMIYLALNGWINHIETGTFDGMTKKQIILLSHNCKDLRDIANNLPVLTQEQQEGVSKIRELAHNIITMEQEEFIKQSAVSGYVMPWEQDNE